MASKPKWTRESFILAAEAKFPGRFDYSQVVWKNVTTKVVITCKEHGDFEITPTNFLHQKHPCRKCCFQNRDRDYSKTKPRITTEIFVKKAIGKHGSKYDYSLTKYVDKKTKIKFTCKEHGIQNQNPRQHLKHGCQYCNGRGITKHNQQSFIEKSVLVHGDKYVYDKVNFVDLDTKVTITCKEHGDFQISPKNHINSNQGCTKCGYKRASEITWGKLEERTEKYLSAARKKHKYKYNYEKTKYINKYTHIVYECPTHGYQTQNPIQHLRNGCQYCSGRGITKYTTETFIQRAIEIHGDKYNYDKVTLINNVTDHITIICPKHGDFSQEAKNHINGRNGCPKCASEMQISSKELEILDFIKQFYNDEIVPSCRNVLPNGLEIDIYIPNLKLGIEFHGNFFHTESKVGKEKHLKKAEFSCGRSIRLIQIFEHEWEEKKDIVKSRIKSFFGLNTRIYARKCEITQITSQEKDLFLQQNHIKGRDKSSHNLCLKYKGEIVACMTFGKPRFNANYTWELIRYCSKKETNIAGGASKLLNAFRNQFKESIISYADRRWSDGNLYKKLGFTFVKNSYPGYFYYNPSKKTMMSRMMAQKGNLQKSLPIFDPSLTEHENMLNNGYERIFDAGNSVWVFR